MSTSTDPVRQRMATANPARTEAEPPGEVMTAAVLLDVIDDRSGAMTHKSDSQGQGTSTAIRGVRRNWAAAFVAGFAVVLIVGISIVLLNRGGDSFDVVAPVTTSTAATATTVAPPTTLTTVAPPAAVVVPDVWDPILAETRATAAPPAAICPAGTDPDAPGPADQARPEPGWVSNQAAAFDRHAGRIVYVDVAGETWTFDVCTATWQNMNPEGSRIAEEDWHHRASDPGRALGELVYDIDSDRTIAFGAWSLAVYDANTNAWAQRNYPSGLGFDGNGEYNPWGAVYDPLSGLVVTGNHGDVSVYDVDTDEWTRVSPAEDREKAWRYLVGYSAVTDQLVFQGYVGKGPYYGSSDVVVDPRDGKLVPVPGLAPSGRGVFGWFTYATDTETAFILTEDQGICGFDPVTLDWDTCLARHDFLNIRNGTHAAMVGDPINNRLILIHWTAGPWASVPGGTDVWAIDLDTEEWTEILASSTS